LRAAARAMPHRPQFSNTADRAGISKIAKCSESRAA
jgi:hypothetical protein